MKKFLMIGITFFLLLTFVGCRQYNEVPEKSESYPTYHENHETTKEYESYSEEIDYSKFRAPHPLPDALVFTSIEELIEIYQLVKTGKADELEKSKADRIVMFGYDEDAGNLMKIAESMNFAALDKIYIPVGIPEEYQLYKIEVKKKSVCYSYFLEEDLASEETKGIAIGEQKNFQFDFTRWNIDSPMDGILQQCNATTKDLINGKYLYSQPYSLYWGFDREVLHMYLPRPLWNIGISEMKKLTEVTIVDLLD